MPGESGTFARYVLVAALTGVPADSGGAWPRSLPCCPVPIAHRRSVWITRPAGRVGPGAPGNAAHARRSDPSHRGCLQSLGPDGPVSLAASG